VPPSSREFAEFNGLLCSVVEKGLPVAPAVSLMAGVVRESSLRKALAGVSLALGDGTPLPESLGKFPEIFPSDYCSLVRAGIESGRLADVLRNTQIDHSLRARVRSRMTRLFLYLMSGAIMGELVLFMILLLGRHVVAFNNQVMAQMEMREKPLFLEYCEEALSSGWFLVIAWPALLGLAALTYRVLQNSTRAGWLGYAIPVWGRILKNRDLATFCCAVGLRLRSGASTISALQSARDSVRTRRFRRYADQLIRRVQEGESLSSALFYLPIFPKTLSWGISLAEENGEVPRTFDTFSELYSREMERGFALLLELLTPVGVLVIGNVALLAALMILAPFFQLIRISQTLAK